MARRATILTETLVKKLAQVEPNSDYKLYADGKCVGLNLEVRKLSTGQLSARWIWRRQTQGDKKGIKIPLGNISDVTLEKVRENSVKLYAKWLSGEPLELESERTTPAIVYVPQEKRKKHTLQKAAEAWFTHARAVHYYKREDYIHRERQRFGANVICVVGDLSMASFKFETVVEIMRPIWNSRATRNKVLGILRNILNYAVFQKKAPPEVPTYLNMRQLTFALGNPNNKEKHQPALPVSKVPAFMASLRRHEGCQYRMLEFQILLALRTANARNLRWNQVHLEDPEKGPHVTYQPEDLKVGDNGSLSIPLSPRAVEIIKEMEPFRQHAFSAERQYVFPSSVNIGHPYCANTSCLIIEELHQDELKMGGKGWIDPIATEDNPAGTPVRASAHGIARASFRTFAAARADFRESAIELCLHHVEGSSVRRAYNPESRLTKTLQLD